MVDLQNYYENVDVVIDTADPLANRVKGLLDQMITKLPDEEQFKTIGTIAIGSVETIVNFTKQYFKDITVLCSNLRIKDGNCICLFYEDLKEWEFFIALAIDNLNKKSDIHIQGLIAYKISEWSHRWKLTREAWHRSKEMKERAILAQIALPLRSEEYERSVDKEAERLGFAKELLAYDTQS